MFTFHRTFVVAVAFAILTAVGCKGTDPVAPVAPDFVVTFDSKGGTYLAAQTVKPGRLLVEPQAPTKEKVLFAGWYADNLLTKRFDFSNPITQDTTLYAKWKPRVVTVNFNSRGGSPIASQTVEVGKKATKPIDPTKGDLLFDGWYSDGLLTERFSFSDSITTNVVLYAKWLGFYTVTFDSRGGSPVKKQTVEDGKTAIEFADPTRESFKFVGWFTDKDLEDVFVFGIPITADITLYAKWLALYTITFDSGEGSPVAAQTVEDGRTAAKPADPTRMGNFEFAGWFTDEDLEDEFVFGAPITNNITLYAKWLSFFTITFDSRVGSAVAPQRIRENSVIVSLVNPTQLGYIFDGWYSDGAYSRPVDPNAIISSDVTFYAKWRRVQLMPSSKLREWFLERIPDAFDTVGLPPQRIIYFNPSHASVTSFTNLDLSDGGGAGDGKFTDLTGIEHFTSLDTLNCSSNEITTLDVSALKDLAYLDCSSNEITMLDVSALKELTYLDCSFNQLTSLDLSDNTALKSLSCRQNGLTSLDLSKNVALEFVSCLGNHLRTLDIRGLRNGDKLEEGHLLIIGGTNALTITKLMVHENLKDHEVIRKSKGWLPNQITISVYSAAPNSVDYTRTCANYNPRAPQGERCVEE